MVVKLKIVYITYCVALFFLMLTLARFDLVSFTLFGSCFSCTHISLLLLFFFHSFIHCLPSRSALLMPYYILLINVHTYIESNRPEVLYKYIYIHENTSVSRRRNGMPLQMKVSQCRFEFMYYS